MIIDLILNRKDNDEWIKQGYTHVQSFNGDVLPLAYDPRKFYFSVLQYGEIGDDISAAMDYGDEKAVRSALCEYIVRNEYNPDICKYIHSVTWLA